MEGRLTDLKDKDVILSPWKTKLSKCKDLGTGHVEPGTPWSEPDIERLPPPTEEK